MLCNVRLHCSAAVKESKAATAMNRDKKS